MNERIRELAEQAVAQPINLPQYVTLDWQKFAELIVEECIQVCESRVGNRDYNTGRMHCASDLKEHFGVE